MKALKRKLAAAIEALEEIERLSSSQRSHHGGGESDITLKARDALETLKKPRWTH